MPKLLFARPPVDAVEERRIHKLAGARHAPADWIRRAQIIAMSWDGLRVPAIAAALGCSQRRRCAIGWPASPPTGWTGSVTGPAPVADRGSARPSAPS